MAIFAGMELAVAGSAMQGILKNPLASPFTLGITFAATFGASLDRHYRHHRQSNNSVCSVFFIDQIMMSFSPAVRPRNSMPRPHLGWKEQFSRPCSQNILYRYFGTKKMW